MENVLALVHSKVLYYQVQLTMGFKIFSNLDDISQPVTVRVYWVSLLFRSFSQLIYVTSVVSSYFINSSMQGSLVSEEMISGEA